MQIFYFYLIIGITLITLEVVFTSFYLLVIGVIFILSSLLAWLFNEQLLIGVFSGVFSVVACGLLKLVRHRRRKFDPSIVQHIGQSVEVVEIGNDILRVKYSGSYWDARLANKSSETIQIGDRLTITKFLNKHIEVD